MTGRCLALLTILSLPGCGLSRATNDEGARDMASLAFDQIRSLEARASVLERRVDMLAEENENLRDRVDELEQVTSELDHLRR